MKRKSPKLPGSVQRLNPRVDKNTGELIFDVEPAKTGKEQYSQLKKLGFFGAWKHRKDIPDGLTYVRALRAPLYSSDFPDGLSYVRAIRAPYSEKVKSQSTGSRLKKVKRGATHGPAKRTPRRVVVPLQPD